jgi:hypothetical protein
MFSCEIKKSGYPYISHINLNVVINILTKYKYEKQMGRHHFLVRYDENCSLKVPYISNMTAAKNI